MSLVVKLMTCIWSHNLIGLPTALCFALVKSIGLIGHRESFGVNNAGINLTGYHPPRAPRGFCTEMCAQPPGFCTTENARGLANKCQMSLGPGICINMKIVNIVSHLCLKMKLSECPIEPGQLQKTMSNCLFALGPYINPMTNVLLTDLALSIPLKFFFESFIDKCV